MSRTTLFCLILLTLLVSATTAKDTTRVLWIGNSYTDMNFSMPSIVGSMAAERTTPYFKKSSIKGGRGWGSHWNEDTIALNLIKTGNWDYVILQDGSSAALDGNFANFVYYGKLFCSEVFKAGAKPILYCTWAYEDRVPKYDSTNNIWLPGMQDTIIRNYYRLADTTGAYVAPIGVVHGEIVKENRGVDLWADGTHPNASGANLSSGTHFATLFGQSLQGMSTVKTSTDVPDSNLIKRIHNKIDSVIKRPGIARYLPPSNRPDVTSIRFLNDKLDIERYYAEKLRIETTFSNGTKDTTSNTFTFRMVDSAVAAISYEGYVTGLVPGQTQLIARRKSASDTITVTIKEITAVCDSIRLSYNQHTMLASDTFPLQAVGYFHDGSASRLFHIQTLASWNTTDTSLVKILPGKVIGKGQMGSVRITVSYQGKQDTCRLTIGPALTFALRINCQASATPYNFGWEIDNVTQGYSGNNITGWQNHSSLYSYDDRNGDNYLLKTFTMPYGYAPRNYRIKAPSGSYIIKIAMGDNKSGSTTTPIYTAYGTDTLLKTIGVGNVIKKDTITVTAVNGYFDLSVLGQLNYLVLISNQGVDIDAVAWDEGKRIVPFTVTTQPPQVAAVKTSKELRDGSFTIAAYPNPLNPKTVLAVKGVQRKTPATLSIHDIRGRCISQYTLSSGNTTMTWDGSSQASGIYYAVLTQGTKKTSLPLFLIR